MISRDFDRLRSLLPPDTWLGWIDQLSRHDVRLFELATVNKELGSPLKSSASEIEDWISIECDEFRMTLLDQQAALLREKGDYRQAINSRVLQLKELIDGVPFKVTDAIAIKSVPKELQDILRYCSPGTHIKCAESTVNALLDEYIAVLKEGRRYLETRCTDTAGQYAGEYAFRGILFRLLRACHILTDIASCLTRVVSPGGDPVKKGLELFVHIHEGVLAQCLRRIADIRAQHLLSREALSILEASAGDCQARIAVESIEAWLLSVDAWEEVRLGIVWAPRSPSYRRWEYAEVAAAGASLAEEWEDIVAIGRFPSGVDYCEMRARLQALRGRASYLSGDVVGIAAAHSFFDIAQAWLRDSAAVSATDSLVRCHMWRAEACLLSVGRASHPKRARPPGQEGIRRQTRRLERARREIDAATALLSGRRPALLWEELCLLRAELSIEHLILMSDNRLPVAPDTPGVFDSHCRAGLRAVIDALDCQIKYADTKGEFEMRVQRVLRRWAALYCAAFFVAHNEQIVRVWVSDFHRLWDTLSRTLGYEVLIVAEGRVNFYTSLDKLIETHGGEVKEDTVYVSKTMCKIIQDVLFCNVICRDVVKAVQGA